MRLLYTSLVRLLAPLAFVIVVLRGLRDRAYWEGLGERFGWGPAAGAPGGIWLHAVSLGEVSAAAALVRELRERHPELACVISTATPTGRARARALFGGDAGIGIRYLPYDTPGSVGRFLRRVRPRIAVIMETELWPNLLHACSRRAVPIVLANARLTARSVRRYLRFGRLFRDAVAAIEVIAAQSAEDAGRFAAVGADSGRIRVVGSVKFDVQAGDALRTQGAALRAACFGARPVWIAGSTHEGEEEAVLDAHALLRARFADALLLLVPRHPQRFEEVAALLARGNVPFDRRSAAAPVRPQAQVLLVDSVGELATLYAAADVAFVGGSLVPIGGHNLLEPAALGVPVLTGPYNDNAPDIARELLKSGGGALVEDAPRLAGALEELFGSEERRRQIGARARAFVDAHRGSIGRLHALIEPLLSRAPAGGQ